MDDGLDASVTTPLAEPSDGASAGTVDLGVRVTTEGFSGPLDLLLYLVRRTELDIVDIPLVLIIDQFVATIGQWADLDLEVAGDFIAMAATLLEIKARLIAPPPEEPTAAGEDEGDAFDPRADLINSLLAYRRFKEATQELAAREDARRERLDRQLRETIPEDPEDEPTLDMGSVDSHLLLRTCELLMARINGLGPRTVTVDDVPLGVHIDRIVDSVRTQGTSTLGALITAAPTLLVRVSTVMAVLEGTRQRFLESRQVEQYGDVGLRYRDEEERARVAELPPEPPPEARRRRRPPLVTWTPPASAAPLGEETPAEAAADEPVESDDERFLRELDESCRLNAVLAASADLERAYTAFLTERHPELLPPAPVVVPEVVAPVVVVAEVAAPAEEKQAPKVPTARARAVPVAAPAPAPAEPPAAPVAGAPTTDVVTEADAPTRTEPAPAAGADQAPASIIAAAVAAVQAADESPATPTVVSGNSETAAAVDAAAPRADVAAVAPVEAVVAEADGASATIASTALPDAATAETPAADAEPADSGVPAEPAAATAEETAASAAAPDAPGPEAPPAVELSACAPAADADATTAAALESAAAAPAAAPAPPAETAAPPSDLAEPEALAPADALAATELPLLDAAGTSEVVDAIPAETREMSPADTLLALAAPALAQDAAGEVPTAADDGFAAAAAQTTTALDPIAAAAPTASDAADAAVAAPVAPAPVHAEVDRWSSREDEPRAWPVEAAAEALEARLAAAEPDAEDEADQEEAPTARHEDDDDLTASDDPASANAMLLREIEAAAEARRAAAERERARRIELAAAEAAAEAAEAAAAAPAPVAIETLPITAPVATIASDPAASADADITISACAPLPDEPAPPLASAAPAPTVLEPAEPTTWEADVEAEAEPEPTPAAAAEPVGSAATDLRNESPVAAPEPMAADHPAADEPGRETAADAPTAPAQPTAATAPAEDTAPGIASAPAAEPLPTGHGAAIPEEPLHAQPTVPAVETEVPAAVAVVTATVAASAETEAEAPTTPPRPPSRPSTPVSRAATETRLEPIVASDGAAPPPPTSPPDPGPPPGRRPRRPATFPLPSSPTTLLLPNTQQNAQRRPMPAPPLHRRPWFAATAGFALAGLAGWAAYEWLLWLPKDILEITQGPLPDQEVSGRATLRWSFNLDVVAPEQVGKPEAKPPTLSPATAGTWTWTDRRSLSFTPDQPLVDGTPYTIALAKDQLRTSAGFRLAQDLRATVHTPALAVREARLVTYAENGAATVELLFNQPVDPAAIAKRLIVEAPGGEGAARPTVTAQDTAHAAVVRFAIAGMPQPALERDSAPPTDLAALTGGAQLSAPAGGHVVSHPGVTALLRLPGGTTGAGGPLGLAREWSSALPLGATLALTDAWAQIPAAGDATVHLGLSGAGLPEELLAKLVHVTPALRVKIEAVPGGLVLRGGFTPGERYTVALDAVWPERGDDPTLALATLPAACTATLAIPQRPRALWLERVDGVGQVTVRGSRVESAALAVYPADAAADAEPLRQERVALAATSEEEPARLRLDAQRLLRDLPSGAYEVRLAGEVGDADEESAPALTIRLHLDAVAVAPGAVAAGLGRWTLARLRGEDEDGIALAIGRAEPK